MNSKKLQGVFKLPSVPLQGVFKLFSVPLLSVFKHYLVFLSNVMPNTVRLYIFIAGQSTLTYIFRKPFFLNVFVFVLVFVCVCLCHLQLNPDDAEIA